MNKNNFFPQKNNYAANLLMYNINLLYITFNNIMTHLPLLILAYQDFSFIFLVLVLLQQSLF